MFGEAQHSVANMSDTSSSAAVSDVEYTSSSRIQTDKSVSVTQSGSAADETWVHQFDIPWSKCSYRLMESLNAKAVPMAADVREVVLHTMSDVFEHTRRPSRKTLRIIARKIVEKQPLSFADYINGKIVDDGVNSLMLMMESKKENMNRRVQPPVPVEAGSMKSSKCKGVKYAAAEQSMADETIDRLEGVRKQLSQCYKNMSLCDLFQIDHDMLITYAYQRYQINRCSSVSEILQNWPFLGVSKYILLHFKYLTHVDVETVLRGAMSKKCELIHAFMTANTSLTRDIIQLMNKSDKSQWPLYILPLLMRYFREDNGHIVQFLQVHKPLLVIKHTKTKQHPVAVDNFTLCPFNGGSRGVVGFG